MTFKDLQLNPELLDALSYMNFKEATPIQQQAIPEILKGKDIIACAQTGTGKTAAFILPILHKLIESNNIGKSVNTLVVCPTRELAIQIDQQIQGFSYFSGISSMAIYGGGDGLGFSQQQQALSQGCDIIVATPGKLISHLNMGYVKFENIQHLILDEADRMLDMGFYEDIQKIISFLPSNRQNLMFSATMPAKIRELVKKTLNNPVEISIAISKPSEKISQGAYLIHDYQKPALVAKIIAQKPDFKSIIIFSSTIKNVSNIVNKIKGNGYTVEGISSELEQHEREEVLLRFKSRRTRVLVATDVLSRGIDVKDIDLVINYDVPNDAEDYVHRIGRTARAESKGVALTFINSDDVIKFQRIEKLIEKEVRKLSVPPELGETPKYEVLKNAARRPQKSRKN